ncbi:MAG: hypothetical protein ACYTBP_15115 [Planctomycetota bacterium]
MAPAWQQEELATKTTMMHSRTAEQSLEEGLANPLRFFANLLTMYDKRSARCRSLSLRSSAYRRLLSLRLFTPLTGSAHAPPIKGVRADSGVAPPQASLRRFAILAAQQPTLGGVILGVEGPFAATKRRISGCRSAKSLLYEERSIRI